MQAQSILPVHGRLAPPGIFIPILYHRSGESFEGVSLFFSNDDMRQHSGMV